MALDLQELQDKTQLWREHSFPPEHRTAVMQALGGAEEAGELAHAILKMEQGIRGDKIKHVGEVADSVGDIIIYLAGICSSLDLDLQTCVEAAWAEVSKRDWSKNPETGLQGTGDDALMVDGGEGPQRVPEEEQREGFGGIA